MSIKLTDTQLVILSAAAQREDRCLITSADAEGRRGAKGREQADLLRLHEGGQGEGRRSDLATRRGRGEDYALKLTAAGAKAIAVAENPEREHGNDDGGLFENADEPTAFPEAPLEEAIEPDPVGPSALSRRVGLAVPLLAR